MTHYCCLFYSLTVTPNSQQSQCDVFCFFRDLVVPQYHSEEVNLFAMVKTRNINAAKNKNRRLQPSCSLSVGIYVLASKAWSHSTFRHCYYVVWSDISPDCLSPWILGGGLSRHRGYYPDCSGFLSVYKICHGMVRESPVKKTQRKKQIWKVF